MDYIKPEKELFFKEQEVATRWNVSVKLLQKWRLEGGGPKYCKLGRSVRYPLSSLLDYEHSALYKHSSERSF